MKGLKGVELFAHTHQLDGPAGDRTHRKRRTAAGVTIDTGEHDTGQTKLFVEGLGHIDRVLAGHGIGHQQRLMGLGRRADRGHLVHQFLVDGQPARGVQEDHVVALEGAGLHGALGDGHRRLARHDGQGRDAGLEAQHLQLLLRGGAAHVERGHQGLFLVLFQEAQGDLGAGGRLTGALQADQHDADRRRGLEADLRRLGAQHLHQVVVDNLDDLLAGRDGA